MPQFYGRGTPMAKRPSLEDVDVKANRAILLAKLSFGTPKKSTPAKQGRNALHPNIGVNTGRGKDSSAERPALKKRPSAGNVNVAANAASLASKLHFGPPPFQKDPNNAKSGPHQKRIAPPHTELPLKLPVRRLSVGRIDMGAQRAALASKLQFRPPLPADPKHNNTESVSTQAKATPNPDVRTENLEIGTASNITNDFKTQQSVLASKLQFRPPLPAAPNPDVHEENQSRQRTFNTKNDFTDQRSALPSKLNFCPPLPSSPKRNETSGAPPVLSRPPDCNSISDNQSVSTLVNIRSPTLGEETQTLSPHAGHEGRRTDEGVSHFAGLKKRLNFQEESKHTELRQENRSVRPSPRLQPVPPMPTKLEPEMQYVRSYNISKNPDMPEPEMNFVRSYSISKGTPSPPSRPSIPLLPKISTVATVSGDRTTRILLQESYEWGTKPSSRDERKREWKKKRGTKQTKKNNDCTIM